MRLQDFQPGQTLSVIYGTGINGKSRALSGTLVTMPFKDKEKFGNGLYHGEIEVSKPSEWAGQLKWVPIHRLELLQPRY